MRIRCGDAVVKALEDEGARFTFGIPGTHNTELYDSLERSGKITPVLVTDEQSASFMADAVSRSSGSLGVANVVPGAGVTHCLSGVAEAFMDNVAMLVLTCGIRGDTGKAYQLHDVDQLAILKPITKGQFKPTRAADVYPMVRRAARLAKSGTPGPVAVEIPAELYLLTQEIESYTFDEPAPEVPYGSEAELDAAARLLNESRRPALYVGFGARAAGPLLVELAEKLGLPVTTTIQGKGVFPESHPLWLWNGFGASAPPHVRAVMDDCDCLLAIGCRFGEVATASYGLTPPASLIHVDINAEVFNRNYPAKLAVRSDASAFVRALLPRLKARAVASAPARPAAVPAERSGKVSAAALFKALQKHAGAGAIYTTDSGNGTFLAMENLRLEAPGRFLGPIDYSCMGYAVPAAVGAKFANPDQDVIAIAGDGALLMTGLELLTAAHYKAAPAVFVLRDGQLAQISQLQKTTLNRDTCTVISEYVLEDLARAVRCEFLSLPSDAELEKVVPAALALARQGKPVVVEVAIDYSEKTFFTRGIIQTNFWRLPLAERFRMLARAVGRRLSGG